MAAAATYSTEDLVRRMAPVTAPPEQQAQVVAFSRVLEGMVQAPLRRAPKCQLVGPNGEMTPIPDPVPQDGQAPPATHRGCARVSGRARQGSSSGTQRAFADDSGVWGLRRGTEIVP